MELLSKYHDILGEGIVGGRQSYNHAFREGINLQYLVKSNGQQGNDHVCVWCLILLHFHMNYQSKHFRRNRRNHHHHQRLLPLFLPLWEKKHHSSLTTDFDDENIMSSLLLLSTSLLSLGPFTSGVDLLSTESKQDGVGEGQDSFGLGVSV